MIELTDWHHLMGMVLTDFFTETSYDVTIEADLSKKKQILDMLIIRKKEGNPPKELPDGFENLAIYNLLSYKSVQEPFDDWAADELVGHFVNYRKQVSPSLKKLLPKKDFRLYAVSTRFPRKLAEQERFEPVAEGVYDVQWGGRRKIRLIVTSRVSKKKRNALWLMFSAVQGSVQYGVSKYEGRLDEMSSTISQLFAKYRAGGINMPYTVEDYRNELERNVLKSMTPERKKEELLKGLSAEELLKGLSAEELLKGLSAEELLKGFSVEELLKVKGFSSEEIEAFLKKSKKKQARRKKL
ncbi:MAG: hypothetical protein GY795_40985 [Desulfobacterales bacterium]|nr:hypothetical protein [Desulfobacterales bacterium]